MVKKAFSLWLILALCCGGRSCCRVAPPTSVATPENENANHLNLTLSHTPAHNDRYVGAICAAAINSVVIVERYM